MAKWLVAVEFPHLAFPLPFPNNCLSSSVDHRGVPTCGGLGTSWWHVGWLYGETGVWS